MVGQVVTGPRLTWRVGVVAALSLALSVSWLGRGVVLGADASAGLPAEADLADLASQSVPDSPALISDAIDLAAIQAAAYGRAESMPLWQWSVPELAYELEHDPMRAYEFVRDHIAYEPYHGVLRGADGTLAARAGNSIDRALLLSALLRRMLVPHRFAFAGLDAAASEALLDRALVGPAQTLEPAPLGPSDEILGRATRDYARLRQALGEHIDDIGRDERGEALEAAGSHVWVQMAFGAEWLDLDPTMPTAVPGETIVPAQRTSATIGQIEPWTVDLEVNVETLRAGTLSQTDVLDVQLDPLTSDARETFLYFREDTAGVGGAIVDVITGDEQWAPVLLVDGVETEGRLFSAGGRGTDLLGDPTDLPELVGVRLDVTVSGPGSEPRRASRILLDRLPPAARAAGDAIEPADLAPLPMLPSGPLALASFHHVMISTGSTDLRRRQILMGMLAGFLPALLDEELSSSFDLTNRLWPMAAADHGLVVASEQLAVPGAGMTGGRSYIDRPRVFISSIGVDPADESRTVTSIDLLHDGVRVLLPREQAGLGTAHQQLWYGALQTAIETEFLLHRRQADETAELELGGVAFAMDEPLVLIQPGSRDLPAAAPAALAAASAAGAFIVVPEPAERAEGWWTIDAQSGVTRSILDPGLGGVRRVLGGPRTAAIADGYLREVNARKPVNFGPGGGRPLAQRPPPGSSFGPGPRPAGAPRPCGSVIEYDTVVSCIPLQLTIPLALFGFTVGFLVEAAAIQIAWGW